MEIQQYLQRSFNVPSTIPSILLEDEAYVARWYKAAEQSTLDFLAKEFGFLTVFIPWERPETIELSMVQTLAGKLPCLRTHSHQDFCYMVSLLNGRLKPGQYPATVNAMAMSLKSKQALGQRVIVLNDAPYSNIPSEALGLNHEEWLTKSYQLRLRHECAHYECLRFFGSMEGHIYDELIADSLGQLAAFGYFSATYQRLFFGLSEKDNDCTGRLNFYLRQLEEKDHEQVIVLVKRLLLIIEDNLKELQAKQASQLEILLHLIAIIENNRNL